MLNSGRSSALLFTRSCCMRNMPKNEGCSMPVPLWFQDPQHLLSRWCNSETRSSQSNVTMSSYSSYSSIHSSIPSSLAISKDFSAGEEHRKSEDGRGLGVLLLLNHSSVAMWAWTQRRAVTYGRLSSGSYSSFEYLRRQTFNGWVLDKVPFFCRQNVI